MIGRVALTTSQTVAVGDLSSFPGAPILCVPMSPPAHARRPDPRRDPGVGGVVAQRLAPSSAPLQPFHPIARLRWGPRVRVRNPARAADRARVAVAAGPVRQSLTSP